ncbi:TPA: DUF551 domain-containing protein [Klebsiella pneumoniae]|nr:hypothetical protein CP906_19630 [Klebsiella pneumoniae]HCT7776718.1 DUF551 domain-containing protein [Klebsiella pneumoniae]
MTKSTITREQLEEWVAQFDEDGGCDATDRQLEALIRQSLAAMGSEPVIIVGDDGGDALSYRRLIQSFQPGTKLYRHAQPVPVVPGKWIPVSERMPIEFEAVIAFDGDQVYGEAMYSSDDGFTIDGYEPCDRLNLRNVTHWMPLPSAPQEVK